MARGHVNFQFLDHSNEKSTASIYMNDIPDGATYTTALTRVAAMQAAIDALSIGTLSKVTVVADDDLISETIPADPYAQRETKWWIPFVNTATGKKGSLTIPCANLAGGRVIAGTDLADLSHADWIAFEAELENAFWSPNEDEEGNYVMQQPYVVGRNL